MNDNFQVLRLGRSLVLGADVAIECICILCVFSAHGDKIPSLITYNCNSGFLLLIFMFSLQLFELLGPDGLEMISTLLQKRAIIVSSFLKILPERTSYKSGEEAQTTLMIEGC